MTPTMPAVSHHRPSGASPRVTGLRAHLGERGAALVELALVMPLLLLIVAGTYDYGRGWRVGLITGSAARAGARIASAAGRELDADKYLLSAVKSSAQASGMLNQVSRVIIYRSDTANGAPPAACLPINANPASSVRCNIITGNQLRAMTDAGFNATTGCLTAASVKNWCPNARNSVQLTADYIGVQVEIRHNYLFKVLGNGTDVKRRAVMRLEPG